MDTIESQVSAPAAPVESAPTQDAPIQDAPSEGSGQDTSAEQQPQEQKPREPSRLQKRIDEITRQRYEEQRAREAAEARLAQYEREQAVSRQFSEIDAKRPSVDQFQSLQEYGMALADWSAQRAAAVAMSEWERRQHADMQRQAEQTAQMAQHQQRAYAENQHLTGLMASAVKKYPDFQQIVSNPELPSIRGTPAFYAILQADNFADISYALAKNPAELERLGSIADPVRAGIEIARMDAKFSGNAVTTAPAPPPSRNGTTVAEKSTRDMSDAEWMAWREGQLKSRSRR